MRRPLVQNSPELPKDADAAAGSLPPRPAELVPAEEPQSTASAGAPESAKLARLSMFLQAARDPAIDAAKLKELRAMAKEDDEDDRKREFLTALAQAKAEFTPIIKTRLVDYPHKDGRGRTSYKYEELADITDVVVPILSKYGITHSYDVKQEGGKIRVSCILAHANGHTDTPRMQEGVEDTSGQKSANQAVASTITFLERGTLKQALGLAAGRDDDGAGGEPLDPLIEPDDVAYVEQLIRDTESDLAKFLETIEAPSIAEMRMSQFKRAVGLLNRKKRMAASGTAVG
jgi:hypothetical protein